MIARLWHGWTAAEDADDYERLLRLRVLPEIVAREIPGYRGAHLLRRPEEGGEVEFLTVLWFEGPEAVRAFAGEDHERSVVPSEARELLRRYDETSRHYEVVREPGG